MNWKCRECVRLVPYDWLVCPWCNEVERSGPVYMEDLLMDGYFCGPQSE